MTIVSATGFGSKPMSGGAGGKKLSAAIQAAVEAAIKDCHERGVTDQAEIKAAMMEARRAAKKQWDDAINLASAAASQAAKD